MSPPPAKEQSTATILLRLARHVEKSGEGVFGVALKDDGTWLVSMEFGREAADSPMAAGAAYGIGKNMRRALESAAHDCGILTKEEA